MALAIFRDHAGLELHLEGVDGHRLSPVNHIMELETDIWVTSSHMFVKC